MLRLVPPFAGGRRRELVQAPRVHFYDPGLRNATLGAFGNDLARRPDRDALAEGLFFAELAKTLSREWSLHYWRSKGGAQVDFVLVRGARLVGVEVKAGRQSRLSRSSRSFIEAYAPEALLLVSGDDPAESEELVQSTKVQRLPLHAVAGAVRKVTTRRRN